MYHLKAKLSPMSKIITNSLSKDADLRNYSFIHKFRTTSKMDITSNLRCSFLQGTSCKRFSSYATKTSISKKSKKLSKLKADPDEKGNFEEKVNDINFYGAKNFLPETLGKKILKEENLELFKEIAQGDNAVFDMLKYLQVKLDITCCQYGVKLALEKKDWLDLLNCSPSKRRSFVAYLIVNAIRDIKRNYENPPPIFDLPQDEEDCAHNSYNDVQCYHLFHNSMFMKIRDTTIKKLYYFKGFSAMLYAPSIIIDCSYEDYMTVLEIKELAKQLASLADINLKSESPFNIIFCNFNKNNKVIHHLNKINPVLCTDEYPLTITKKSYLDICSKNDLVYLTPHCKTPLRAFNPEKTYIIGAFVDKTNKKPVSLAKAKEQNIAMASLPIDEFLDWGCGSKCLPLPHVTKILLDLKCYDNNWMKALEVIPKRCLDKTNTRGKARRKNNFGIDIIETFDAASL